MEPKAKKSLSAAAGRASAVANARRGSLQSTLAGPTRVQEEAKSVAEKAAAGELDQKDIEELIQDRHDPRWKLLVCLLMFMVGPAAVLGTRGYLDRRQCNEDEVACNDRCAAVYESATKVFQSDYMPERECRDDCASTDVHCNAMADSVIMGAGLLCCGFFCAVLIFQLLDMIQRRFGGPASVGASHANKHVRPRAAYMEPVLTESEKQEERQSHWWWRSGGDHNIPLKRDAMCRTCQVKVAVDSRWETCEKGGMEGAVCPRCRNVVVGVL